MPVNLALAWIWKRGRNNNQLSTRPLGVQRHPYQFVSTLEFQRIELGVVIVFGHGRMSSEQS